MASDSDLRLHHLDTIQATIARLSQNSFTVRGWSVALVSLVFAVAATRGEVSSAVVLVAVVPAWTFWGLDAYYLRQERLFRMLYADAAESLRNEEVAAVPLFDMNTATYNTSVVPWWRIAFTPAVAAVPLMLTAVVATVLVVGLLT